MDALLAVVGAVSAFVGWMVGLMAGRRRHRPTPPELPSPICLACGGDWRPWSRTTHMTTDGGVSIYYQQRDCKDCGLMERRRVHNP